MIFSGDLCGKVLDGSKTQTRRPVTDGRPCQYKVGHDYAVQPGRGKHQLGRIRVLSVTSEVASSITAEDALAEGFASTADFGRRWTELYGPGASHRVVWRIEFVLAEASN